MTTLETKPTVDLWIPGLPAPQGSKRAIPRTNRQTGRTSVTLVESSDGVKPWREDIRWRLLGLPAAERDVWPLAGPIRVGLLFVLKRPKSTPKSKTPAAVKKPDLDKLQRAVLDAIGSAGVYGDDSQVTSIGAGKRLAELDEATGCQLAITQLYDH